MQEKAFAQSGATDEGSDILGKGKDIAKIVQNYIGKNII